jgi:hypothetical protein
VQNTPTEEWERFAHQANTTLRMSLGVADVVPCTCSKEGPILLPLSICICSECIELMGIS